jgi:arylsulfatase A-like enzyme/Tfp pilus assembly protein PilF
MPSASRPRIDRESPGCYRFYVPLKALTGLIPTLLLFLSALASSAAPAAAAGSPLNVLLVTIDTLRTDRIGFYGLRDLPTPHLDRLAAKSAVFTRAFAQTVTTLPSHTNILLGTTPSYHGVHDNAHFVVRGEFLTLAEHLQGSGYATGAFVGGFPLDSRFGLDQGFSVYDDTFDREEIGPREADAKGGERPAGAVWASAHAWLKTQKSPWFLWVHFYDPHYPYAPPEPYRTRFARNPYDGEVAYTDAVMGELLAGLKDLGQDETTLIVLTGDHGESLGEHGETTHGYLAYNATLWIPLFIRVPGFGPRVVDQNVSHIDLFPTVCDLLKIKPPSHLQGASLVPLLRGKSAAPRPIYFESLSPHFSMGWAPLRGLVDGPFKFIDSPRPELYDLRNDFDETRDLAGGADAGVLKKKLDRIVQEQSSPDNAGAERQADRATQEKLRSLGYLAGPTAAGKKAFAPEDSVSALLPYHNRAVDALDLFRAGKIRESIDALREVLTARKNVSAAYANLAFIYGELKRPADAIDVLRLGLEAMPEDYDIYFQLIARLYDAGRFEDVLGVFDPRRFPQVEIDPVIWNYIGLTSAKRGDLLRALADFEKSLAIDGQFAMTYYHRGAVHFDVYRTADRPESLGLAVADFLKATELDPAYGPAFLALGVAYFRNRQFDRAITGLEKALALDSGLVEAHFFLGSAYLEKDDTAGALAHFTKYKDSPAYGALSPAAKSSLEEAIARCKKQGLRR